MSKRGFWDDISFSSGYFFYPSLIINEPFHFAHLFIGNLIVLIVAFRKHNYRFVTNCYIINLAITDLLFLLISVPLTTHLGLTDTWILDGFISCRVHVYFAHVSCMNILDLMKSTTGTFFQWNGKIVSDSERA